MSNAFDNQYTTNDKATTFNVDVLKMAENMLAYSKLGKVYYPLKANSDIEIIEELIMLSNELGIEDFGFLVTNMDHFNKLKSLEVPTSKIGTVNVLMDDETIKRLYDEGVRYFTFHSLNQIINFSKYADLKKVKINVRLNISEVFNQFSHLGATKEEAKQMLMMLQLLGCTDYGISFYLQKEIVTEKESLPNMLDYIADNFKGLGMNFVNIGGAKKIEEIDQKKLNTLKENLQLDHIILEPARYLVGNTVEMETNITDVKPVNGDYCVIIRNGIYSGLVDTLLYNKRFKYYLKTEEGRIPLKDTQENLNDFEFSKDNQEGLYDFEFYMCGASSDSGDRLGKFHIDEEYSYLLRKGAIIVVPNAGCYVSEFFMPLGGIKNRKYNFSYQKSIEEHKAVSK